jgi:type IV pilus assembly protein PilA
MVSKNRTTQKGFSLVELLIVIAIMGVLAAIAFNAFNGVLNNSRKKADEQQAKNIERALRAMITETGIPHLIKDVALFKTAPSGTVNAFTADIPSLIAALQKEMYVQNKATNRWFSYGPYLTNPRGDTNTASYDAYAPQWNLERGGKHTGYDITIWTDTQNVIVWPSTETTPSIRINPTT